MKEISKNQQSLQRETNAIMRDCAEALEGLKSTVMIYFKTDQTQKKTYESLSWY